MAQDEIAQKLRDVVGMIYVEGTVTKVAGQRIGIYIYDRYAKRIADFVGRKVKLIVLDIADD
ncbi:MAG: hypothetical protein ACO2PN_21850 [Pyrobaculum sp.]|jgi:hypothetical protein